MMEVDAPNLSWRVHELVSGFLYGRFEFAEYGDGVASTVGDWLAEPMNLAGLLGGTAQVGFPVAWLGVDIMREKALDARTPLDPVVTEAAVQTMRLFPFTRLLTDGSFEDALGILFPELLGRRQNS